MRSGWRIDGGSDERSNAEWHHSDAFDPRLGFVGIPLAWGVVETLLNALKLFQ
ncbi:MAG: hypothetical protein ABSE20_04185 [Acetobacteraceae bacterium]|jgi:hypothetical protein